MRALSLTQPWATLVAIGAKKIETRSWSTTYRGPIAIHAAQRIPATWIAFRDTPFREPLEALVGVNEWGCPYIDRLPRGAVIATARLIDVLPTEMRDAFAPDESDERAFGDYSYGRYMWVLRDVAQLNPVVPVRGRLGLWEWTPP